MIRTIWTNDPSFLGDFSFFILLHYLLAKRFRFKTKPGYFYLENLSPDTDENQISKTKTSTIHIGIDQKVAYHQIFFICGTTYVDISS